MANTDIIFVKAKIRLRTTAEGGRISRIKTGYRPNHVFEYKNDGNFMTTYIGEIQFDKDRTINLGEEVIVTVKFMTFPEIEKFFHPGRHWYIHEGKKLVGEGDILEVLKS